MPGAPPGSSKEERKRFHDQRNALLTKYGQLEALCQPVFAHRDKRIAHHEKEVVLGSALLPLVSDETTQAAMTAIAELVDEISIARTGVGVGFYGAEMDVEPVCRMLIYVLRAGNSLLDEKEAEYRRLLKLMEAGEAVANIDEALFNWRKWFKEEL